LNVMIKLSSEFDLKTNENTRNNSILFHYERKSSKFLIETELKCLLNKYYYL